MNEIAPAPPKVRVTRAQLKKIQKNYEIASKMAKDTKQIEEIEREVELQNLDSKLDEIA